jgi:hypothetical protein
MSAADKLQELAKMLGAAFRTRSQAASTLPEKIDSPVNQPRRILAVQHDSGAGDGIMNSRRLAQVTTALCGTVGLAGWVVASLIGFGSADIENAGAVPIEDRRPPSLTRKVVDAPQATALGDIAVASTDAATVAELVTGMAAWPNRSQVLPPEISPVQVATANTPDPVLKDAREAVYTLEIFDECLVVEICIDQYLWTLYQRTPKQDTIKVHEQRKVTVKRKRKMVTVTRTFTKLVPQDFAWKDPKAAEKAGMPIMDYVIGGLDRSFKLKLFHTLHAAEQAGLSPGITSAFRDDYRQSITSGLKAATDRSYHGGSFRGGYGRGLAADVVSVKGGTRAQRWVATENLWKWIDAHDKEFGIGRPYLDKDPPHVAPIDGKEYAARRGLKAQHAQSQSAGCARRSQREADQFGSAAKSGHASCGSGAEMNTQTSSAK